MKETKVSSTIEQSIEFSPVACYDCRTNHRKCDRKKPTCDACKIRGFDCNYSKALKRKLKKQILHEQLEDHVNTIDFYYHLASYGLPIVERDVLTRFVSLIMENGGEIPSDKQEEKQIFETGALFYSIKAFCECIKGTVEDAEKAASKSKEYLSRVFDNHSSLPVIASYYYLCWIDFLFGRIEKSQFYFQILKFFKGKLEKSNVQLSTFEKNAYQCICYVDEFMFNERGLVREFTFDVFLQTIPRIFIFDKSMLPNGWDQYLKHPHLIDSANCFEVWTMLEMLFHESKENDLKMVPHFADLINTFYNICECGTRLALLSKSAKSNSPPMEYILEKSAATIALAVDDRQFTSLPFEIMVHVSIAANYHLQKVKSGILSHKGTNYVELLCKELTAYKQFNQKYLITSFHFSNQFSQVEQCIQSLIYQE